jgi:translocation protein SEC63
MVDYFTTRLRSTFTIKMSIAWTLYILLLLYVKSASAPMDRFDPFEILQITESASEGDIKKAYRKLSLQYHPDKNPDPEAADYFAHYIVKAYKALTDEVSRENFKKYGHPDGQQAVSISVALPEWFFNKDKEAAPAILLTLLLGGIVLPLGLAACYMGKSNRYTGANEVMMETIQFYMFSPFAIKQYQSVGRLPETLICAMEFLPPQLPFGPEQGPALEALRRSLGAQYPEVRDLSSAFFRKRHAGLVKAHMLLLAHMARIEVDQTLKKDLTYILEKAPRLLQEMFNVASMPRMPPNYGWLTPTQATVELMQCIIKAVPPEEKKKTSSAKGSSAGGGGDGIAGVLQLPHVTDDVIRKLNKQKLKGLSDIQRLNKVDRRVALQTCGLSMAQADDVETALSAVPTAFVSARIYQDDPETGEESTADALALSTVMTCCVHTMVLRAAHQVSGFDPESIATGKKKNAAIRAFAPNFPFPRDEHWVFMLGNPSTNELLAWTRVSLVEAEAAGARYASHWMTSTGGLSSSVNLSGTTTSALLQLATDEDEGIQSEEELVEKLGQKIELKFVAPKPGKHDLVLYVMPDSWVGLDRSIQLKIRTIEPTRAEKEGRVVPGSAAARSAAAAGGKKKKGGAGAGGSSSNLKEKALDRSEESEAMMAGQEDEDEEEEAGEEIRSGDAVGSDGGSEDDEDEDEEEEGDREYDSDEYGTEESGSDDEDGEKSGSDDD